MKPPWTILSYTCGLGERFLGKKYFQYSNQKQALSILICACLAMNHYERISWVQTNTAFYFNFITDNSRSHIINDMPERFKNLIAPVLEYFGFYFSNDSSYKMNELNTKSSKVSQHLIDAYTNKQKGISIMKKYSNNIFHASCYWPFDIEINTCCICGCKQSGFNVENIFYCFNCIFDCTVPENIREVWENKSLDATGNKIKMYTRYITPNREIVFFDRDGERMIYLNGRIELPLQTEILYPLNI